MMSAPNGERPLILCVDDDESQLTLRKLVLERSGFDVLTATTCAEALRVLDEHKVELVLTDHLLGSESGVELAKRIKSVTPALPVVMLSGFPPFLCEDVVCYISKGEPTAAMVSVLKTILAG